MSIKRRTLITVIILLICIIIWGLIVYIVDPFYLYHKPWLGLEPVANKQEYQILGIAKHFEYDNVIIGSSMTENFNSNWFKEKYDGKTIKLCFQQGKMENYDQIFDAMFSNHEIKNVFFGLDHSAIVKNPEQTPAHSIPEFISDDNWFTDVEYLYNKDVMFNYLLPYIKINLLNQTEDFNNAWSWQDESVFSKEIVLRNYKKTRLTEKRTSNLTIEKALKYAEENMKAITKYIEGNPNTNFYIFYCPWSILAYDDAIMRGDFESSIVTMQYASEELLKYDNVKLYLFQDMRDIITNLDLYKDIAHYNSDINKAMFEDFEQQTYRITKENYIEKFKNMREFLLNYDYETLLEK